MSSSSFSPTSPFGLSSGVLLPFEAVVNRCITQDPVVAKGVTTLAGRVLEIAVTFPRVNVFVGFQSASVTLGFEPPRRLKEGGVSGEDGPDLPVADASITGSATTLLKLMNRKARQPLVNPGLKIGGDVEFVQAVYGLFQDLEIDWQDPLSRLVGDIPTHALDRFLHGVGRLARDTRDSVVRNVDEYLHEEARVVPPRSLVEHFDRGLDDMRLRLDRLEARLHRVIERLPARET